VAHPITSRVTAPLIGPALKLPDSETVTFTLHHTV